MRVFRTVACFVAYLSPTKSTNELYPVVHSKTGVGQTLSDWTQLINGLRTLPPLRTLGHKGFGPAT